jgi:hypothetical protein
VNDVTQTETQNLGYGSGLPESMAIFGRMKGTLNRNSWLDLKSMTLTLEKRLEIWIVAHCHEQSPRPRRVTELNTILLEIYNDRRFWKYRNNGNRDYYEDALSLMWQYFFRNLCEATTARSSGSFLETHTYAVGRLLINLQGHLKNIQERERKELNLQVTQRKEDGTIKELDEYVPNPKPELAPLQVEAFLHLLETDPTSELNDRANTLCGETVTMKEPYTLTAQTYLLMRHRDEKTIQQIADELDIPRGTLQGRGKPTKWKELERKLAEMAMDSVSA